MSKSPPPIKEARLLNCKPGFIINRELKTCLFPAAAQGAVKVNYCLQLLQVVINTA